MDVFKLLENVQEVDKVHTPQLSRKALKFLSRGPEETQCYTVSRIPTC